MTRIRRAVPGDAPALRDCAEAAYAAYIPRIGRRPAPMDADFPSLITAGEVWVTPEAGSITGYIVLRSDAESLLIENVAVLEPGRGLGRALMAHAEAQARATGCTCLRLYTNVAMTENLTLYPHLGYTETGRRRVDGFHRVFFEKHLT